MLTGIARLIARLQGVRSRGCFDSAQHDMLEAASGDMKLFDKALAIQKYCKMTIHTCKKAQLRYAVVPVMFML